MDLNYLQNILNASWSESTCYPKSKELWSINNKSLGQCAITSLIVNDYFGYDIYKCKVNGISHYFNMNNDKIIDLTKEQFNDDNIEYQAVEKVTREDILSNENTRNRYLILKDKILLKNGKLNYFTIENNDIIYKRLKNELSIMCLPYLGTCMDFGMGDICLEESNDVFKFYIIDRTSRFEYEEFSKVEDAIKKLITYYEEYELVDNSLKMEEIFYETLRLEKNKNVDNLKTVKMIKLRKK